MVSRFITSDKFILGFIAVLLAFFLWCGFTQGWGTQAAARPAVADADDTLQGRVVTVNGYTYNCIKYTTVDRGGLWCDRVDAKDAR